MASAGVTLALLAWLWAAPGGGGAGTSSSHHSEASSSQPAKTAPSATKGASPSATAGSDRATSVRAGARRSGCVDAHYKTPDGPAESCVATGEVCALGSPYYVKAIDDLCGRPSTAHLTLTADTTVREGDCLALQSHGWAQATVDDRGQDHPAADCNAFIDRVLDNAGQGTTPACREIYPGTRMTFPALVATQQQSRVAKTLCVTVNMGA